MTVEPLSPFPDQWRRAVLVAAHPDDVEWGAGAAVAAWTRSGKSVRYVLATRGEAGIADLEPTTAGPLREREERAAAELVGVAEVSFLGHVDGRIREGLRLRRDIAAELRRHQPELVVVFNPYDRWGSAPGAPWNSADHRVVGRAALDAVSDAANRWIHPELAAAGLEPWDGVQHVAILYSHQQTHAVDVTGYEAVATAALTAHARYLSAVAPGDDGYARRTIESAVRRHADRFGGRSCIALEVVGG